MNPCAPVIREPWNATSVFPPQGDKTDAGCVMKIGHNKLTDEKSYLLA